MSKEYRAKVFKSGNSLALRLPKALGMKEGQEMIVREERSGFAAEPVPAEPKRIDLTGIWGSCPGLQPLTPEEREFEGAARGRSGLESCSRQTDPLSARRQHLHLPARTGISTAARSRIADARTGETVHIGHRLRGGRC